MLHRATVLVMILGTTVAWGEGLWLGASGVGELPVSTLSSLSSMAYGSVLVFEDRDRFVDHLSLGVQLGYTNFVSAKSEVQSIAQVSALVRGGYRIPVGMRLGIMPYIAGGIGLGFSEYLDGEGNDSENMGLQALGEGGLSMEWSFAQNFALQGALAYTVIGEAGGLYSGVQLHRGIGWKLPLRSPRVETVPLVIGETPVAESQAEPEVASPEPSEQPAPEPSPQPATAEAPTAAVQAESEAASPEPSEQLALVLSGLKIYHNIIVQQRENGATITIESSFRANSSGLSHQTQEQVVAVAMAAKELHITKLVVKGYVAADKDQSSDSVISLARANAIKTLLEGRGYFPGVAIEAVGKGREDPVGDNATTEGRARNRRVDIEITLDDNSKIGEQP